MATKAMVVLTKPVAAACWPCCTLFTPPGGAAEGRLQAPGAGVRRRAGVVPRRLRSGTRLSGVPESGAAPRRATITFQRGPVPIGTASDTAPAALQVHVQRLTWRHDRLSGDQTIDSEILNVAVRVAGGKKECEVGLEEFGAQ